MDPLDRLPTDVSRWPDALAALNGDARKEVTTWLVREWIFGRLEPRLSRGSTHPDAPRPLRRQLAVALPERMRPSPGDARFPESEDEVRRWCWINGWVALSQDEDLILMEEENLVPLLDEASAECPKRDYVLFIVAHGVRDGLHASLRQGPDAVRACLGRAVRLLPHARAASADKLVEYLERLESWTHPGPVDRAGAVDRCGGVNRCYEATSVGVELTGGRWRWAPRGPGDVDVLIDRETGAMWGEPPPPV